MCPAVCVCAALCTLLWAYVFLLRAPKYLCIIKIAAYVSERLSCYICESRSLLHRAITDDVPNKPETAVCKLEVMQYMSMLSSQHFWGHGQPQG